MTVAGYRLPFLLLGGFRRVVDEAHRRLAAEGVHVDIRPTHGFTMQAVGDGATVSDVGRALGISKQAAAKTVESLLERGYLERVEDPGDARRKVLRPTAHGRDLLTASARLFDDVYVELGERLGPDRVESLREDLEVLAGDQAYRIDGISWFGAPDSSLLRDSPS